MFSSIKLAIGFLLAGFLAVPNAQASILLTMDDLVIQPVNGLVHPTGVSFGFTVGGIANVDANYASGGPGNLAYINDPSIEGTTTGILEVVFPGPFNQVKFGVAVSSFTPSFVNVELFNALNVSLGTSPLALSSPTNFVENQFNFTGVGISRFRLDLTPSVAAVRFAFDNLFLDNVPLAAVPEPASFLVFLIGSLGLVTRRVARYQAPQ